MKRLVFLFGLVLAVALLIPAANVKAGSGALCSVSPQHGPPGTVFSYECSGFSPNTYISLWNVDPSGVAQNGEATPGAPNSIKTDEAGRLLFTWYSPGGQSILYANSFYVNFSSEFGNWTWYFDQLCYGKPCIVGSATVHMDSVPVSITGAELSVSPDVGIVNKTTFSITGHSFTPLQPVSLWLTMPPMCDTSNQVFAISAASLGDVKADASGNISSSFFLPPGYCQGNYSVTAREVRSERGAIATFRMDAEPIAPTYGDGDTLTVSPNTINAAATAFEHIATVSGSGFQPYEIVSCWITRPDNAVAAPVDLSRYGFDTKANAGGQIAASIVGTDLSSNMGNGALAWSAMSGPHRVTCRGNASGVTQFGSFLVVGTVFDP